ncbi:anaphase-promoting complex subunit 1 isoform X2 [Nematostella vectensis]|uniref:anaphase-promoting complex subunit 1 isoform X2 n=1 Tax=Nematostella vectensis TaxID=45351 RepID=UPI0020770AA7|nr:anaphase-promoting complex subunit 1 isoform X2 [Nematostella vectensis]
MDGIITEHTHLEKKRKIATMIWQRVPNTISRLRRQKRENSSLKNGRFIAVAEMMDWVAMYVKKSCMSGVTQSYGVRERPRILGFLSRHLLLTLRWLKPYGASSLCHQRIKKRKVNNVWAIPGGLMLERAVTPSELAGQKREVPTLFSLLHPLDEPRPVTSHAHDKVSYICDPTLNVLYATEKPPVVMMYDSLLGLHSLWLLSDAVQEDVPQSPRTPQLYPDQSLSQQHHTPSFSASVFSRLSLATPTHSPLRLYTPSPAGRSQLQSPVPLRLMSPALGQVPATNTRSPFLESPLMMNARSPAVFRSPPGGGARDESYLEGFEPLAPEICLRHTWQEAPTAVRHGAKGKASKVLLTSDMFGNIYVCYLVKHTNRLRLLKLLSNEDSKQLIVVPAEDIPAKDVVEIKELNMMLVLGMDSSLILYSGQIKACVVHLPNIAGMASVATTDPIIDEVMLLSPPATDRSKKPANIQASSSSDPGFEVDALQDPVPFGCNLMSARGTSYRLLLPKLCENPTVLRCINALKCLLPASAASQLVLGFYCIAHHNSDRLLWEIPDESGSGVERFVSCLQRMLGYRETPFEDPDEQMKSDSPAAKKSRTDQELEGDAAWEWLLSSDYHQHMQSDMRGQFQSIQTSASTLSQSTRLEHTDALLNHLPSVLFTLHLVYEDLKLDIFSRKDQQVLCHFLCKLSRDLGWERYTYHYYRDYPVLVQSPYTEPTGQLKDRLKALKVPDFVTTEPPSIHNWLVACLRGDMRKPFPLIKNVCRQTFLITMIYSLFMPLKDGSYFTESSRLYHTLPPKGKEKRNSLPNIKLMSCQSSAERVIMFMAGQGVTATDLDRLPIGVGLPLREAIHMCTRNPPFNLSQEAFSLIGREDLAAQASARDKEILPQHGPLSKTALKEGDIDDGMEFSDEIMKLRFGEDLRVQEVRRLLQSARPAQVRLVQKPEVSDHDFIQEQETKLLLMCKRVMALSVGRGMFTLATSRPILTETLPIPTLELTGRAPPRNTVVGLDHVDCPADMRVWPQFHNGVAAGLKIAPGISQIDSTWIVYNKPKELTNEHAGFLMALGLNGHLGNLSYMNLHDYLCKGHELTTVGLLLGISAARRASMDLSTTKVLSIHVDALLPPTSAELDVPHSAQVAGVLGVGLVYEGTAHRRMAEVLLSEIGRPAGPDMENAVNRESYSLAAGLALGLVMLQHGNDALGVSDLKMADQLFQYMVGGQKKPQTGTQKEKFKSPSYLIKEGDTVNIDVTAAGATLALGLMFMKTNNSSVASWLDAPDTQFLLDSVRPDFLLLRLLSRGLIMWDSIQPCKDWVESHIPDIVQKYAFCADPETLKVDDSDIDLQTLSQAKASIIAGCCLAMGMRFAGSANQEAFTCLMHYTKYFKDLLGSAVGEQAGKPTLETCMDVCLISVALVMAGSGNLEVLRITRQLHKRHSADVSYGSHMAVHMSIGLLFLGGGRYTLSTSGPAVAALVCALYPKFPISSTDNRYHLQAFRHLYVLAAEPRVLVTREVENNTACYVPIQVTLKSTEFYHETTLDMISPCILPEYNLIKKISVVSQRYLPISIDLGTDSSISRCLSKFGTVFVKRRAGYLSYADDPKGYRNLLARTFPEQSDKTDVVRSFSSEPQMVTFAGLFCDVHSVCRKEKQQAAFIGAVLHECITDEKPGAIGLYMAIKQAVESVEAHKDPMALWELKLVLSFYGNAFAKIIAHFGKDVKPLLSEDFVTQCKACLDKTLDHATQTGNIPVSSSLDSLNSSLQAVEFAIHHDLPPPHKQPLSALQGLSLVDAVKNSTIPTPALVRLALP